MIVNSDSGVDHNMGAARAMIDADLYTLGLVPLLFGYHEHGKKILYPLSAVLLGGYAHIDQPRPNCYSRTISPI